MNGNYILAAVFVCVLLAAFTILNIFARRREMLLNLEQTSLRDTSEIDKTEERIDQIIASDNEYVRHYFNVARTKSTDSLEFRLIRAGYLSKQSLRIFQIIRFFTTLIVFIATWIAFERFGPSVSSRVILIISAITAAVGFIINSIILDHLVKKRRIQYRKLFPDFMDLLVVCVDAGLSLDAALDRVTQDFMSTNPGFATHLGIMGLEIRAGRPIRDALRHFADRIDVDKPDHLQPFLSNQRSLVQVLVKHLEHSAMKCVKPV